jgi:hypothetical protein
MKFKILILLLIVLIAGVFMVNAQECYSSHYKTVGLSYTNTPISHAIGAEYGYTANESNSSFVVGANLHIYKTSYNKSEEAFQPLSIDQYIKFGYRVSRVEYTLSTSIHGIAGYDFNLGPYGGGSIKFLVPMNTSAISLEPIYLSTGHFRVQATITFIVY